MTRQLQDKVAIVTGASNGIGRAIAETFAAEGAKTVLVARRAELLDEVAAGIEAKGGTALPVPADLTSEEQIAALFDRAVKIYGRLDVLVNNAGIATHKNTEDITLQYWQEALAINITAPFLCSREAIRIMKAQTPQGGRIINIGSVSAEDAAAGFAALHGVQARPAGHDASADDGRAQAQHRRLDHPSRRDAVARSRRGAGGPRPGAGATPDDYVMAGEDVAKVAVLMAALPGEVNLYEATILPNHMRSFIGRG